MYPMTPTSKSSPHIQTHLQVQLTISSARKPTSYHFAEEAAEGRGQGKGGMRDLQVCLNG